MNDKEYQSWSFVLCSGKEFDNFITNSGLSKGMKMVYHDNVNRTYTQLVKQLHKKDSYGKGICNAYAHSTAILAALEFPEEYFIDIIYEFCDKVKLNKDVAIEVIKELGATSYDFILDLRK